MEDPRKESRDFLTVSTESQRGLRNRTYEINSASFVPAPTNLAYADKYSLCGAGIQLKPFPFESGSHG
jgi:hypothetical protein